jgi:hypothetical protein
LAYLFVGREGNALGQVSEVVEEPKMETFFEGDQDEGDQR